MSYVENRQTGPAVYNYAGSNTVSSYIAQGQQAQPVNIQQASNAEQVNIYRTSNVQPVNIQNTSKVQAIITSQPITSTNPRSSQLKGSRA